MKSPKNKMIKTTHRKPKVKKPKEKKDVEIEIVDEFVDTADITDTTQIQSAENLISQAINKGLPVETMERLLAMRKELKMEFAREAFNKDMAKFQRECPTIKKTKEVRTNSDQIAYRYAPIELIVAQVKDFLNQYGFSYAIKTEMGEGKVKSICIVKHKLGYKEESEMEVPLGNKTGIMSNTQVVAAASTFAKRYAFCNAFGIMTGDDDDDAMSTQATTQPLRQEVKNTVSALEKLKGIIKNVKDLDVLNEYYEKIKESKKYNEKQKAEIMVLVEAKSDEFLKEKAEREDPPVPPAEKPPITEEEAPW